MKFSVNQKDLQNSLNYCQGVIEKRSTLPILSNVLLEAKNQNLKNYCNRFRFNIHTKYFKY